VAADAAGSAVLAWDSLAAGAGEEGTAGGAEGPPQAATATRSIGKANAVGRRRGRIIGTTWAMERPYAINASAFLVRSARRGNFATLLRERPLVARRSRRVGFKARAFTRSVALSDSAFAVTESTEPRWAWLRTGPGPRTGHLDGHVRVDPGAVADLPAVVLTPAHHGLPRSARTRGANPS
jgi:hypothetical protein